MNKITSIEHAQQVLGTSIDFNKYPDALRSCGTPEKDILPQQFNYEIWLITEANNKLNNWKVESGNPNQIKYSIWAPDIIKNPFRPAGLGLAFYGARGWRTRTICGARLEVGSREEARYIFEDFIEKWDFAWLIQEE